MELTNLCSFETMTFPNMVYYNALIVHTYVPKLVGFWCVCLGVWDVWLMMACVCVRECVCTCVSMCVCVFKIVPKANWTLDEFLIWHVTYLLHVHTHVCVHMFLSFAAFYSASDKAGLISLRAATILKTRNQLHKDIRLPTLRTKPGIWLQDS